MLAVAGVNEIRILEVSTAPKRRGLSGQEIPKAAAVVSVSEVVLALTTAARAAISDYGRGSRRRRESSGPHASSIRASFDRLSAPQLMC